VHAAAGSGAARGAAAEPAHGVLATHTTPASAMANADRLVIRRLARLAFADIAGADHAR
jgi:hypothetical protein